MPLKSRSCFPVNRSQNIVASPSRLPAPRQPNKNPAKHPRPPKILGLPLDLHRHRHRPPLAESCLAASLEDFPVGYSPMRALNPRPPRYPPTKTLVSLMTAHFPRTEIIRRATKPLPWSCPPLEAPI